MLPELARHTEKLYYFYEIANTGNLRATARKLGISPPTLSYSIKQLEAIVGVTLFHRSQKGTTVTEAGKKLFTFCRRYYRELEEVQKLIQQPSRLALTHLKIGTFQSIAIYFWPLLLKKLKQNPEFSVSIRTDRSQRIIEALIRREVDVALTVETKKHGRLISHHLYKDEYNFYISGKAKRNKLRAHELELYDVLYVPDAPDQSGKTLRQYLHSWGLSFKEEFELDSMEVIAEFVRKGYGVGILPAKVARTYKDALKSIRIEGGPSGKFGPHRFFLTYRDDLDIPQHLMTSLLESARMAVVELST